MLQEPKEYFEWDHFFFQPGDDLEKVCNAPKDKKGVFKVIELRKGRLSLVYVGFTDDNLFDEIVYGLHHNKNPRRLGWIYQIMKDETEVLDVYWYAISPEVEPKMAWKDMLQRYIQQTNKAPKWNKYLKLSEFKI